MLYQRLKRFAYAGVAPFKPVLCFRNIFADVHIGSAIALQTHLFTHLGEEWRDAVAYADEIENFQVPDCP